MSALTPPAQAPSVADLNRARESAIRMRARFLLDIADGSVGVIDVLDFATLDEGRPLRQIKLLDLMMSDPKAKLSKVKASLSLLRSLLGLESDFPDKQMTVGWLLDSRTGGRRFNVFLDIKDDRTEPWPGFPFTVSPFEAAL